MPRWKPELIMQSDLIKFKERDSSMPAPGAHEMSYAKFVSPVSGNPTIFCKPIDFSDIRGTCDSVVDVMYSVLYRYVLGDTASESRFLVNSQTQQITHCVSIGLDGFFDLATLSKAESPKSPSILISQKYKNWCNKPQGLIRVPFYAWLFGDNDLHHRNVGWCHRYPSVTGEETIVFAKIDHGFAAGDIPFLRSGPIDSPRYKIEEKKATEITLDRLLKFPISPVEGEYGRYWPFIETKKRIASQQNRTSELEAKVLCQLWAIHGNHSQQPNCLFVEKQNTILSAISLLFDHNWKALNKYLSTSISPLFPSQITSQVQQAIYYILVNVVESRIRALVDQCFRAPEEVRMILTGLDPQKFQTTFEDVISSILELSPQRGLGKTDGESAREVLRAVFLPIARLDYSKVKLFSTSKTLKQKKLSLVIEEFKAPASPNEYFKTTNYYRLLEGTEAHERSQFSKSEIEIEIRNIEALKNAIILDLKAAQKSEIRHVISSLSPETRLALSAAFLSGNGLRVYNEILGCLPLLRVIMMLSPVNDVLDLRRLVEHSREKSYFLNEVVRRFLHALAPENAGKSGLPGFFQDALDMLKWNEQNLMTGSAVLKELLSFKP